jgi:glycosyltransferase involved in cell wall biosynthesis
MTQLTIVVPCYNEQEVLPEFHRRLAAVLDRVDADAEVIYVNDGSRDQTIEVMRSLASRDERVTILDLSRNFGKEIALTAGLDHAQADAVVVIDADLQDPPELIPELIRCWREGFDVVYAKRASRAGETWIKKVSSHGFYRIIQRLSRVHIPEDTGDFRLMSRRATQALAKLREQHRFMKGLFGWIGYPQTPVLYRRDPRFAGKSKWDYWRLWNFALEGITSFSTAPLKIATYTGISVAAFAFLFGLFIIYRTVAYGDPVRGYPSLMVTVLFIGGVQLVAIGVLGEYVGRIFDETKGRPLYLLNSFNRSPSVARRALPSLDDAKLAAQSAATHAGAEGKLEKLHTNVRP